MPEVAQHNHGPILTAEDQVAYLHDIKNVSFNLVDEEQAVHFLESRNFFFKLKAFAKNFEKYVEKPGEKGQYLNLDFGHLVELSKLDNALRSLVLELALDIEHYLKVRINAAAMRTDADPYAIVETFFGSSAQSVIAGQTESLDLEEASTSLMAAKNVLARIGPTATKEELVTVANEVVAQLETITGGRSPKHVQASIEGMTSSPYSGQLASKYLAEPIPLWVLLELISFGPLIKLYRHCFGKNGLVDDPDEKAMFNRNKALLRCTQQLRNAAAHNDCLLNGLSPTMRGAGGRMALSRDCS